MQIKVWTLRRFISREFWSAASEAIAGDCIVADANLRNALLMFTSGQAGGLADRRQRLRQMAAVDRRGMRQ